MKRIVYILLFLSVASQLVYSQAIGEWEALLSYYNTIQVAETNNYVFAVARGANPKSNTPEEGGSLFSYGKEDNTIKFYSRQDGISDQKITLISYNPNVNTLLIIYENGNIDLFNEKGFYNIPYLLNSSSINIKTIHDIFFYKEYAYLPAEFGIMVINMKKREITDTYKLNQSVSSVCIKDNYLYAVTNNNTILKGSLNSNLLDINNWQNHPVSFVSPVQQIALFQNVLCFKIKDRGVYYQRNDGNIYPVIEDNTIQKMKLQNDKLIAFTTNKAYIFSSLTTKDVVNTGTIQDISSLKDKNTFWLAAGNESLKGIKKNVSSNQYETFFTDTLTANSGPKRNLCAFMTTHAGKLYVVGGDRWADRSNIYGTFMIYDNSKWFNYDENLIAKQAAASKYMDVTSVAVDPKDANHYYTSTWGEGIFEFKDGECIKLYNNRNSALESTTGDNVNYVRVEGLCFDKYNNLWMTNSEVSNGGIKVLKADGTWKSLQYAPLNKVNLIDKILITSKGYKWINVLRISQGREIGIFVLNDNNTIDDTSDDTYNYYTTFVNIADKKSIPSNGFYCMAEDKSNSIFIGTGNGLIICPPSSNNPQNEVIYASRVVRIDEDGIPTYFLDGEKITAIAVDGGNRKWIGTESSGVFLVNEDASETIYNFTTDNSPLLSNNIKSIAIDNMSGKVYFGTDKGIISYTGDATEGSESYSDVYAYPNPVRPEYSDRVTIAGLIENSNVKITDLNGNIIYQGKSAGGQLTWNCRNRSGNRVATGVYLVFAATPDSKESVVTKIMVVK